MIIWFLSGLAGGAVLFYLLDKISLDRGSLKEKFDSNKNLAVKGLVEKKNSYEKEMTEEIQQRIQSLNQALTEKQNDYNLEKDKLDKDLESLTKQHNEKVQALNSEYEENKKKWLEAELRDRQELRQKTMSEIKEIEEEKNAKIEKLKVEYGQKEKALTDDFLAYNADISLKRETLSKEIQAYEKQKSALIDRIKKENEVKSKIDFYHIKLDAPARHDLQQLKSLALSFSKPAVIYKIIWESFYKTPMEALFKKVLGENLNKGGIYKITELNTEKVYIGRTTNFQERWRTHCKRGCGIDKTNSILYDEMMRIGLENFTFEIVEICDKDEQPKREKYWINFYRSNEYGFNQNKGG